MDQSDRHALNRALELCEENNKMLHSMRRSARISSFFRFAYWILILGIALGSFYLIEPYVQKITQLYDVIQGDARTVHSLADSLKNFVK